MDTDYDPLFKRVKKTIGKNGVSEDLGSLIDDLFRIMGEDSVVYTAFKGSEVVIERDPESDFNSRRSCVELVASILRISIDGVSQTVIQYHANLSYSAVKSYLDFLVSRGFVEVENGDEGRVYKTSVKGLVLLYHWRRLVVLIDRDLS